MGYWCSRSTCGFQPQEVRCESDIACHFMPYIKKEQRPKFKNVINSSIEQLVRADKTFDEGELNFLVSSIIFKLWDANPKYANGNKIVGALECIKQEFIRRKLNNYEDLKIKENGDI